MSHAHTQLLSQGHCRQGNGCRKYLLKKKKSVQFSSWWHMEVSSLIPTQPRVGRIDWCGGSQEEPVHGVHTHLERGREGGSEALSSTKFYTHLEFTHSSYFALFHHHGSYHNERNQILARYHQLRVDKKVRVCLSLQQHLSPFHQLISHTSSRCLVYGKKSSRT